jgi:hypothetical protein
MKPLKLTEKQKSKLLEMCNTLFPEYKEIILTKQKTLHFGVIDHISYKSRIPLSIHWFEFCITHLVSAISQKSELEEIPLYVNNVFRTSKGDKWTFYSKFFFHYPKDINKEHLIDYLYKQFKKLK